MGGLGGGEDGLPLGEEDGGLENPGLLVGHGLHMPVVVELGEDGAHAVVAQAARVVGRRDEPAAERIHARQRCNLARVAEVVGVFAAGKGGAGGRFHRHDARIFHAAQLVGHKGGDQSAQVGAAARTPDDHVWVFAQLFHGDFTLKPDDGLVQQHLIEPMLMMDLEQHRRNRYGQFQADLIWIQLFLYIHFYKGSCL